MKDEMIWVIKRGPYYVNPNFITFYTGLTTGFTAWTNKETMQKQLDRLDEGYYSEFVNYNSIPDGEKIYLEFEDIKDAEFWECGELGEFESLRNCLTPGRMYGLLWDRKPKEYYFEDNLGNNVNYFLSVPGRFLR